MTKSGWFRFIKFWFPLAGYSAIIFYVSSLPSITAPLQWEHSDKMFHVLEYGPFGLLLARALASSTQIISPKHLFWMVILGTLFYGISDEYHQSFVEGRSAGLDDVIADVTGGILGFYVFSFIYRKKLRDGKGI